MLFLPSNFFSGLIWDEALGAFIEATQIPPSLSTQACLVCDSQKTQQENMKPVLSFGSFSYLGIIYHELDFIYALHEEDKDGPYIIAQILSFTSGHIPQVQIKQLEHYDSLLEHDLSADLGRRKDEVCGMQLYKAFFDDIWFLSKGSTLPFRQKVSQLLT